MRRLFSPLPERSSTHYMFPRKENESIFSPSCYNGSVRGQGHATLPGRPQQCTVESNGPKRTLRVRKDARQWPREGGLFSPRDQRAKAVAFNGEKGNSREMGKGWTERRRAMQFPHSLLRQTESLSMASRRFKGMTQFYLFLVRKRRTQSLFLSLSLSPNSLFVLTLE